MRHLRLRIYWDDHPVPGVDSPLGDFFAGSFGRVVPFRSRWLTVAGGGYLCMHPMPFGTRAVVEITNDHPTRSPTLFFQVQWHEEATPGKREYFHARWQQTDHARDSPAIPILDTKGRGQLLGLTVSLQCRDWWLRRPLRDIVLPRGMGLGLLEGWETIQIDDEPPVSGTGLEDYFNSGFYFQGGPFHTDAYGCLQRSFLLGRASGYRFHVEDPVPFNTRLRITLDHGFRNTMSGVYSTVVYWLQAEPGAEFGYESPATIGPPPARLQVVQIMLVAAMASVPVVAMLWAAFLR
ncbi:MAG: hypothetical protein ACI8RZ_008085 [Myxococcota bacterium]